LLDQSCQGCISVAIFRLLIYVLRRESCAICISSFV